MTTLHHPFLDPTRAIDIPKDKRKDVDELYEWIQKQPRFPQYSYQHAHLFLFACFWDMPNAKKALEKYGQIRAASPDLFSNRDPLCLGVQNVFNLAQLIELPNKTPEGYHILVYRLYDTDPSKVNFGDAVKTFAMFNDVRLSENGIAKGYVVVFDMKGLKLSHLTRIQLGPMRTFMAYIQEAHPVRLKKVYVVHTASFINQIMILVKPLIKSELLSLLHFTTEGPLEIFSKDLLPEDYGGTLEPIEDFFKDQRKLVETKYRDWLIDSGELKDKSKGSNNNCNKTVEPLTGSFNALEID